MGTIRSSDGAFLLGVMGGHTANAGQIYFPSGTPDLTTSMATVDLAGNVRRECWRKPGLQPDDFAAEPGWYTVLSRTAVAQMKVLARVRRPASCAPASSITSRASASRSSPTFALSAVRPISMPAMPPFVTAFLRHIWSGHEVQNRQALSHRRARPIPARIVRSRRHVRPRFRQGRRPRRCWPTDVQRLAELQERLYAEHRWAVLIVLQGMDAAGKDSVIKHVMSGVNPQGCEVHPFKAPSAEELDHDFLWRAAQRLPARGRIGIFNRSHYEEVLVVRVHPESAGAARSFRRKRSARISGRSASRTSAPSSAISPATASSCSSSFCTSPRRSSAGAFSTRLDEPAKRWKFSMGDVAERKLWDDYMDAYEDMIRATSRTEAPWYVVPADHKWFARLVVAAALVDALDRLDIKYPKVEGKALEEMQKVRAALLAEGQGKGGKNSKGGG